MVIFCRGDESFSLSDQICSKYFNTNGAIMFLSFERTFSIEREMNLEKDTFKNAFKDGMWYDALKIQQSHYLMRKEM